MARKFQNRIDYVNIQAYGLGKVEENQACKAHPNDATLLAEDPLNNEQNQESRMEDKLRAIDRHMSSITYSLAAMADRQDNKYKMALGLIKPDAYQRSLLKKVHGWRKKKSNRKALKSKDKVIRNI